MAKSSGGGGRSGRGRAFVPASSGSAADILRQRAAFRASADAPKPRVFDRISLEFTPISPVKTVTGRTLPKAVLDQMNQSRKPKFRPKDVTAVFSTR